MCWSRMILIVAVVTSVIAASVPAALHVPAVCVPMVFAQAQLPMLSLRTVALAALIGKTGILIFSHMHQIWTVTTVSLQI